MYTNLTSSEQNRTEQNNAVKYISTVKHRICTASSIGCTDYKSLCSTIEKIEYNVV